PIILMNLIISLITIIGSIILIPTLGLSAIGYSWLCAHILAVLCALIDFFRWKTSNDKTLR
ncbi:MAG: hypothetical protein ACFFDN_49780, partial [Candidatus Hodarchaeota archaeon]